jgi:hypothetical protein
MNMYPAICTKDGVVWMIGLLQALAAMLLKRGFHINHPLCTGFLRVPVGDVGNKGRVSSQPA